MKEKSITENPLILATHILQICGKQCNISSRQTKWLLTMKDFTMLVSQRHANMLIKTPQMVEKYTKFQTMLQPETMYAVSEKIELCSLS